MRQRSFWLIGLLLLGTIGGSVTLSLTSGQQPPASPSPLPANPPAIRPVTAANPAADAVRPALATTPAIAHDLDKMPPLTRQVHLSAQRGAEWLHRIDNPVTGRFLPGMVPALNVPLEGDQFLHQAGAAFALARAARYFGDERYLMKARQATLSLLAETRTDLADPGCRCTQMPSLVVNRLAAAGLLLMLIHELPRPADDLLQQGEELAAFIRKQQRADGSLRLTDNADDPSAADIPEAAMSYPGTALYGLMLSLRHRPAPWKLDMVRKAAPYYRNWWKEHPHAGFVSWQSAACSEAYLRSRDSALASFVFEMSDWLCAMQYTPSDVRHPGWVGGFKTVVDGKLSPQPPQISCATFAEGLVEACRLTRQVPDGPRFERYKDALANCAQFLTTLQYTEDNSRHYSQQFRPIVMGGFHTSNQDGNLHLESHQHVVSALVQYLASVADR